MELKYLRTLPPPPQKKRLEKRLDKVTRSSKASYHFAANQ